MNNHQFDGHIVLLRGACLWIIMALILAWSLVGLYNNIEPLKVIFAGDSKRVLQAHLDFLIMSTLILGFYATKIKLPWHVRWAMVVGAFTNSSLFMLHAIFPSTDPISSSYAANSLGTTVFKIYLYSSLIVTSYGFGKGAVCVLRSTLKTE